KIVFATNNVHKLQEVRLYLNNLYEVVSLKDIGFNQDIPEPYDTLEENALTKSQTIFDKYHIDCFSDDTGLEVEALNGAPGVFSARYAGEDCSFQDNVDKMLAEMNGQTNRKARFRTVVSLILNGEKYYFEGIVNGRIAEIETGTDGFGYDPIFVPEDLNTSFAEMNLEDKNKISHRGRAIAKLVDFLKSIP
ncbi:MAG: non-canonical purine NTP diphosphatase, partial [Bacteroidales bacterium]|nr:non-canonical purine NTP diphosphatase [Bacteroidales bacterium]